MGRASSCYLAGPTKAQRRAASSRKAAPPAQARLDGDRAASQLSEGGHLSNPREAQKAAPHGLFHPNHKSVIVEVNINHYART